MVREAFRTWLPERSNLFVVLRVRASRLRMALAFGNMIPKWWMTGVVSNGVLEWFDNGMHSYKVIADGLSARKGGIALLIRRIQPT